MKILLFALAVFSIVRLNAQIDQEHLKIGEKAPEIQSRDQNGMIIDGDIWTKDGQLVISRGQEVGAMLLSRLKSFANTRGIQDPIRVLVPLE